jgi:hypothetical protein
LVAILSKCPDFKAERPVMQALLEELYCGIEYCWGKAKLHFRRNNDFNSNKEKFEARIREALGPEVLTLERARLFLRSAFEYKHAYSTIGAGVHQEFFRIEEIKKLLKTQRAHRGVLRSHRTFLEAA